MHKREVWLLIKDMIDCCEAIFDFTRNFSYEDFIADRKTRDATVRNFEVLGEAARIMGPDFQILHPLIEWRRISNFRNALIHEYFGVDYEKVWEVIHNELP